MEFFLILPLVIFVLLAGIQVVAAAQLRVELQGAAREGVRVAATTPDPARAVAAVVSSLDPDVAAKARISVTRPAVPGQPASVMVIVRHTVRLILLPDISFDLAARAAMRTEN